MSLAKMRFGVALLSVGLVAGACAGRPPAPVATVQSMDDMMTCDAIRAEVNSNTQRIAELGTESGAKVAQNVAAGVAGAFLILPLFLMDFQGAAGIDERALRSRNDYLASLARSRCAGPQPSARPIT